MAAAAIEAALVDTSAGQAVLRLDSRKWPEQDLNILIFITIFFRRSAAGVGSLSLLWATTVLLGVFNSSLNPWDFTYVAVISLFTATGLFSIIDDQRNRALFDMLPAMYLQFVVWNDDRLLASLLLLLAVPLLPIFVCLALVPLLGAAACIVLSLKQLVTQDYYLVTGLRTSLNIFYALALIQGALFCIFYFVWSLRGLVKRRVRSRCGFSDVHNGGLNTVSTYLYYTLEKSRESSVADVLTMNMVRCGVELLQTQSLWNQRFGITMLGIWFDIGEEHQRKGEVIMELLMSPPALDAIGRVKDWILDDPDSDDETDYVSLAEKILRAFHGRR